MNRRYAALLVLPALLVGCTAQEDVPEPRPTVTVTAEPEIRTETVTVYEMPPACEEAIAAAGEVFGAIAPAMNSAAELADLVPDAYSAGILEGATGDDSLTQDVIDRSSAIASDLDGQGDIVTSATDNAERALAECEAATN